MKNLCGKGEVSAQLSGGLRPGKVRSRSMVATVSEQHARGMRYEDPPCFSFFVARGEVYFSWNAQYLVGLSLLQHEFAVAFCFASQNLLGPLY